MVFNLIFGFVNSLLPRNMHSNFKQMQHEFEQKIDQNMKLRTEAGHMVQSKGEKLVADYLWDHNMPYVYDTPIQLKGGWIRPDFILPKHNNLIVEFKGMDTKDYNFMFERKLRLLESAGLMALIIKPEDLQDLDSIFA